MSSGTETKISNKTTDWGVVVFPGSNNDHDALDVIGRVKNQNVNEIWHQDENLSGLHALFLPGGFSYGDYLRGGAIAQFSPAMKNLPEFINSDKLVIGICNGFQVLTEMNLLPGSLARNADLRFIHDVIYIRVEHNDTAFTSCYQQGQVLKIPIAHNEGNYYIPDDDLSSLEDNHQVLFRYCDRNGNVTKDSNPNGSVNNIAGIINRKGNVMGMMPHPERRCDPLLGTPDGDGLFQSMIDHISRQ